LPVHDPSGLGAQRGRLTQPLVLRGGGRALAGHLERLRLLLDGLGARLRDGVAGRTVAAAVYDAVHDLLRDGAEELAGARYRAGWPDEEADEHWQRRRDPYDPYAADLDAFDEERLGRPDPDGPAPRWGRWGAALALACQALTVYLRRKRTRHPLAAAAGVGLASALAVYLGGPLFLAGVGLGGAALSLACLADALCAGAAALFALGRP
jgi:hypothetical protein